MLNPWLLQKHERDDQYTEDDLRSKRLEVHMAFRKACRQVGANVVSTAPTLTRPFREPNLLVRKGDSMRLEGAFAIHLPTKIRLQLIPETTNISPTKVFKVIANRDGTVGDEDGFIPVEQGVGFYNTSEPLSFTAVCRL